MRIVHKVKHREDALFDIADHFEKILDTALDSDILSMADCYNIVGQLRWFLQKKNSMDRI